MMNVHVWKACVRDAEARKVQARLQREEARLSGKFFADFHETIHAGWQ